MKRARDQIKDEQHKIVIEKKKLWLEVSKVLIAILGITVTMWTAYLGYNSYSDEKENNLNSTYNETLYQILSSNIADNKIGLKEIVRYETRYSESVPILVNYIITIDSMTLSSVKSYYYPSAAAIGKPFYPFFEEYLSLGNLNNNELSTSRIQELLIEFIKANVTLRYPITMNQVGISNAELVGTKIYGLYFNSSQFENVLFDNSSFNICYFTNSNFKNCSFWKAEFLETTKLNNVRFDNCNFLNGNIRCRLETTIFNSCNVQDLEIIDFHENNYKYCEATSTLKISKNQ